MLGVKEGKNESPDETWISPWWQLGGGGPTSPCDSPRTRVVSGHFKFGSNLEVEMGQS